MMDTGQAHTESSQRMVTNYNSQVFIKAKSIRLFPSCLHPILGKHTYSVPTCDGAHPVQVRQPSLLTEVKTQDLLTSYVNNSPWHSKKLFVLGESG